MCQIFFEKKDWKMSLHLSHSHLGEGKPLEFQVGVISLGLNEIYRIGAHPGQNYGP